MAHPSQNEKNVKLLCVSIYTPVIKIQSFSELCFIKMIKTFTNTLFLGYGYICACVGTWSFLHHPLDQVWAF